MFQVGVREAGRIWGRETRSCCWSNRKSVPDLPFQRVRREQPAWKKKLLEKALQKVP